MRIIRALSWLLLALLAPTPALAQLPPAFGLVVNNTPVQGGSSGQCLYINSGQLSSQACGGVPSGAAGGDLAGTYPNPTVANGSNITNASIANSGLATPAPCSAFGVAAGTCLQGAGALGTPSSGTVTNLTGTASININGTVGATTPAAGTFTALNDTSEVITGGSLANAASAFTLTATQPTSPAATQNAISVTVTSAGSASQTNNGMILTYGAGYTGTSITRAAQVVNNAAGTGGALPTSNSNTFTGNVGQGTNSASTTTGYNVGTLGVSSGGAVNIGVGAFSQVNTNSATNIGLVASALNAGSSPVFIGALVSLGLITLPAVNAAFIADNNAQSVGIALWRNNNSTVASVNQTGGLTATLTNVATTSAVCYAVGTNGLMSYDGTLGTCTVSDERLKNMGERIPNALERLLQINGVYYTWKDPKQYGEGRQIGVGAQTVERVFPELVATDSTGKKSADYQRLTAPIIEALRELKHDNDNIRAELAALKRAKR